MQDTNIVSIDFLKNKIPLTPKTKIFITYIQQEISNCIHNKNNKLIVAVGPCSIHSYDETLEYASKLANIQNKYKDKLIILMRVYFEKPRTSIGWKGFINDPNLNHSYDINKGLTLARDLLAKITNLGLATITEIIDPLILKYLDDFICCGAIGARSSESQLYRELASGLIFPIGFKNNTNGDVQIAVDALKTASVGHSFLSIDNDCNIIQNKSNGNNNLFVILRGGKNGANFYQTDIEKTSKNLREKFLPHKVMIDCSHDNSYKNYKKQFSALHYVAKYLGSNSNILGLMLESNINAGKQNISDNLKHGVSITDGCVSFDETVEMLDFLVACLR